MLLLENAVTSYNPRWRCAGNFKVIYSVYYRCFIVMFSFTCRVKFLIQTLFQSTEGQLAPTAEVSLEHFHYRYRGFQLFPKARDVRTFALFYIKQVN